MSIRQTFIAELQQEASSTQRVLERLTEDKFNWQPHEKSMTLIQLATHLAEMPGWVATTLEVDEMDFGKMEYNPPQIDSISALLKLFTTKNQEAIEALEKASEEDLMANWKMMNNGVTVFEMPRMAVIRGQILNHSYHHRGQLTVYLRMLDIAVPGVYGPSADEK